MPAARPASLLPSPNDSLAMRRTAERAGTESFCQCHSNCVFSIRWQAVEELDAEGCHQGVAVVVFGGGDGVQFVAQVAQDVAAGSGNQDAQAAEPLLLLGGDPGLQGSVCDLGLVVAHPDHVGGFV